MPVVRAGAARSRVASPGFENRRGDWEMRFSNDPYDPYDIDRSQPTRWILIDPRPPGYIGQEIVDLSPKAIELRHVARDLRGYAERREHWIDLQQIGKDWSRWPDAAEDHLRDLSFGIRVIYAIDYDTEAALFDGKPVRHLAVQGTRTDPTPATIGEIATYFYGRRAAQMRIGPSGLAHVVVGMNWEQLDPDDLMKLF